MLKCNIYKFNRIAITILSSTNNGIKWLPGYAIILQYPKNIKTLYTPK